MDFCVYLTYDCEQDSVLEGRPFNKEHREPDCDDIHINILMRKNADCADIDNIMMKRIMLMVLILVTKCFYHLRR